MAGKNGYVTEDTDGKLYRVRDKNEGPEEACTVWGASLTYEEAHKLKERVVGAEKSTTARIENMEVPLPPNAVTPRGEPLRNEPPAGLPAPLDIGGPRPALVTPGARLHPDPQIASIQQKAMAAAKPPAQLAQSRADNLIPLPVHPGQEPLAEPPADLQVPEGIDGDLDELLGGESEEIASE